MSCFTCQGPAAEQHYCSLCYEALTEWANNAKNSELKLKETVARAGELLTAEREVISKFIDLADARCPNYLVPCGECFLCKVKSRFLNVLLAAKKLQESEGLREGKV